MLKIESVLLFVMRVNNKHCLKNYILISYESSSKFQLCYDQQRSSKALSNIKSELFVTSKS